MARIVLVADDSPTIQKKAMGILKGEGFDVETVSNGVAAIKRLALLHPLVILADVSMPGRDGYEVCEYVKKSPELRHAAVLLVASDMEPYDHVRGAEVGADGIIKKPFDPHELASTVTKFADQFEAATAAPPAGPPAWNEPPQEFEEVDYTPTLVQPGPPDFSTSLDGVALIEPGVEHSESASGPAPGDTGQFFADTPTAAPVATPDSAAPIDAAFFNEISMPQNELPAPAAFEPEAASAAPSFLETMGAIERDQAFVDGKPEQGSEPSANSSDAGTMIFHAPAELVDSFWNDHGVPAAPSSETAGPAAAETEVPPGTEDTPGVQPIESPQPTETVTATSLDSFSLEDAANGQVQFASQVGEIAIRPGFGSLEQFPSASFDQPQPAPELTEAQPTDSASHTLSLDQAAEFDIGELSAASFGGAEPAADIAVPSPGAISLDAVSIEQTAETVPFDELPTGFLHAPEPVPDSAATGAGFAAIPNDQIAAVELPEAVQAGGSAAEAAAEPAAPEAASVEFTPEATPAAITAPMPEPITPADDFLTPAVESPDAVESASAEPDWDRARIADFGAIEDVPEPLPGAGTPAESAAPDAAAGTGDFFVESALVDAVAPGSMPQEERAENASAPAVAAPETIPAEAAASQELEPAAAEPPIVAPAPAEPAAAPVCDLELIHSIVRKVAAKMAPPILSPEALEEITTRLANEIAAELAPPPTRQ